MKCLRAKLYSRSVAILVCGNLIFGGIAFSQTKAELDKAIASVYPALVRVDIVTQFPGKGRMRKGRGAGSGAIISKDGYVITNHHVAGHAGRIFCRLPDGEKIEATRIGTDPLADITILKLNLDSRKDKNKTLPVATFGDSDKLKVGDTVLSMGSPAALTQSVTKGIVANTGMMIPDLSNFGFKMDGENVGSVVRWIGHDAVIFGGNSGGPLVNMKGEIVGINEVGIGSLGGAIPSNLAKEIAKQIIDHGRVIRSCTGLDCQPRLKTQQDIKGVLVGGVIKDSPADKAGLKAGDIITSYNGTAVDCRIREDMPNFNILVMDTPVGSKVTIKYLRDGKQNTTTLVTKERALAKGEDVEFKDWGVVARDFTKRSAKELKRDSTNGVYVLSTRPNGAAEEAKPALNEKDVILSVNGHSIASTADLRRITDEILHNSDERIPVLVEFERNSKHYLSVVEVGKVPEEDTPVLAKKAWLPVSTQIVTKELAKALKLDIKHGVRVVNVFPGHSAEKAGMKTGDILLKIDGDPIMASQESDHEVLPLMIRQYKSGSEVAFDMLRDGKPMQLTVKLEKTPKCTAELKRYKDDIFEITVRELSLDDRISKKLDDSDGSVTIVRMEHAGWGELAHLHLNDILLTINGNKIKTIDDVKQALKKAQKKQTKMVTFFVKRGIHTIYLEIEPNWNNLKGDISKKKRAELTTN